MDAEVEESLCSEEPTSPKLEFPKCFKCVVCGDESHSEDGARLLPCLHHICSDSCLVKARNGTIINKDNNVNICPVCSITFGAEQTGRNKFTKDYPALRNGVITKSSQFVKCTYCDSGNAASTYCNECKEFLCSNCKQYHMRVNKTKKHSYSTVEAGMIAKEKESSSTSDTTCVLHDAPFVLYCVECDQELCQMCSKSNHHATHDLRNFTDCVKQFRDMLSNAIPEFIAYGAKTDEAIIDLKTKATNIMGNERIKLLSNARAHFHKVQSLLLQRELDLRLDIMKKTLFKAKELNLKRGCVQSLKKQAQQYLEVIPKLLDYKDHELFSKRQWLTKQYFRLRERVGVLLDETSYKDYVESDWFFHVGDGVLLETIVALKALGGFVYTDGLSTEEKPKRLQQQLVSVSSKPGTIEAVFEQKYKDKHPKELTDHLFSTRETLENNGDSLDKNCELEMEALEISVENEYIGFDNLKKQNDQNVHIKEKVRFVSGTTLETLLDEKMENQQHPAESDLLSKYIADKSHIDDTMDSNSEYDPVLQTARGIEKRRNTHSESEEDREESFSQLPKKRGRKPLAKPPTTSPSLPPPPPLRKSNRFEISPRPGLALASSKTRRSAGVKEDNKPTPPSRVPGSRGRPKLQAAADTGASASGRKSTTPKRTPKGDAPPRLTREVFLDAQQVDDLLGTPTESEEDNTSDDGGDGGGKTKRRKYSKKRKGGASSDDDFNVSGVDHEEQRKKAKATPRPIQRKRTAAKDKDPFTKPKRRRPRKQSDVGPASTSFANVAMELYRSEKMKISNDDNNEDYCTVCLDGGENLICCDNCPKVFHIKCHVPALDRVPPDDWQCLCCVEKDDLDKYTLNSDSTATQSIIFPKEGGLKKTDFIYACKFIADIYAEHSSLLLRNYFERMWKINNDGETPLHLNLIRDRLALLVEPQFTSLQEVEDAVREMQRQASILFKRDDTKDQEKCFKEFNEHLENTLQKYFPKEDPEPPKKAAASPSPDAVNEQDKTEEEQK